MMTWTRTLRRVVGLGAPRAANDGLQRAGETARRQAAERPPIDIAPNDPLLAYFAESRGAVSLDELQLESPAVQALRARGSKIVVPLISQGELIGLLDLGPRLSDQEYSREDRRLLDKLARQAAPAVRVAQLVREQESEVRARERLEQELRVAQLIQQQFLPKRLPELPGWQFAAYYHAAREVGGDFYDFIDLPDGKVALVIGDVTGHGVPAALVMATTRSILRSDAPRLVSPGAVLARANALLHGDIPPNMFVTCLYAVLEPATGRLVYANAGHDLPYVKGDRGVRELRATGMPLGLMGDMSYEEEETVLDAGEGLLLHSDGLAEAHDPGRNMFGFPRMRDLVGRFVAGQPLIDELLNDLGRFTGSGWEQEDDITLVTLERRASRSAGRSSGQGKEQVLASFDVPSEPGNERLAIDGVAEAIAGLGLPEARLERLKTAVGEATMNAIEHGNRNRPELLVAVNVVADEAGLRVRITDQGGERPFPEVETPDLEAKLAGLQTPRGWGLFLIQNMVDELHTAADEHHHTIELVMHLKEAPDARR
jgi:serine phosphatase RsbU (regulator of sigma subunit)/anti-sigma regulatory factor (Ser/Thr protein kinase)